MYKYAASKADYVFQTDSDGQTNPREFEAFWIDRNSLAAIFGARKHRGDGILRALVEKCVCILCFLYLGVRIPDANAPFRLMRAKCLRDYIKDFPDDYAIPNIVLTIYLKKLDSCCFRDVSFVKRSKGKQTLSFRKILNMGIKSLTDFNQFKKKLRIRRK